MDVAGAAGHCGAVPQRHSSAIYSRLTAKTKSLRKPVTLNSDSPVVTSLQRHQRRGRRINSRSSYTCHCPLSLWRPVPPAPQLVGAFCLGVLRLPWSAASALSKAPRSSINHDPQPQPGEESSPPPVALPDGMTAHPTIHPSPAERARRLLS